MTVPLIARNALVQYALDGSRRRAHGEVARRRVQDIYSLDSMTANDLGLDRRQINRRMAKN